MRKAQVFINGVLAAILIENSPKDYVLTYDPDYQGPPVSLTLPKKTEPYFFNAFPTYFEGLLPEGVMFEILLRTKKIDRHDYFSQLMAAGADTVGATSVKELYE